MARPQLTLEERAPLDARGLKRGPIPGVGVHIGRRAAIADVWWNQGQRVVVRFRTADFRHWFDIRAARPLDRIPTEVWADELTEHLREWLIAAMDDEFD